MADLVYLAVIVAFFALAAILVSACNRIIGADEADLADGASTPSPEPEAAEGTSP